MLGMNGKKSALSSANDISLGVKRSLVASAVVFAVVWRSVCLSDQSQTTVACQLVWSFGTLGSLLSLFSALRRTSVGCR